MNEAEALQIKIKKLCCNTELLESVYAGIEREIERERIPC